eukprot:TRINITY_DN83597_c0_g1_i1.p1 TRINITY_DN83597_c0_g1~~TRINITY_DN83597_c0_g1_i1.p1  ORF type:complete len:266 (-),score=26.85 TRINITY_DN83597_c0_g1_i1:40-837(-)
MWRMQSMLCILCLMSCTTLTILQWQMHVQEGLDGLQRSFDSLVMRAHPKHEMRNFAVEHKSQFQPECRSTPKIIHMMFKFEPTTYGRTAWPNPIWRQSHESWHKYFPEPEYMYYFWTDEMIDAHFAQFCPNHIFMYQGVSHSISKSDLARYCILKVYGGIYADLDYEPRANFFGDLSISRINFLESPYHIEDFQNALMTSPVCPEAIRYWTKALEVAEARINSGESSDPTKVTGPGVLYALPESRNASVVNVLPCKVFNRKVHND